MDSLQLAELLCARLCHDLSGPVGAAAAGAELFEDMDTAPDAETLSLVAGAAGGAAQRLKFFRAALGPAASAAQASVQVRDLILGYLATQVSAASPGISLSWPEPPAVIAGTTARLLLNLVLLAKDALPRGGRIRIDLDNGLPRVTAHGEPASLSDEARQVLCEGKTPSGPRGAHAYFSKILAEGLGNGLMAAITADGLTLTVEAASAFSSRRVSPLDG